MTMQQNLDIAQTLLKHMADHGDPTQAAALFAEDLSFEIQGDDGALPWIGRKVGRQAIVDWMHDLGSLTEPLAFDVEDVLASESRAAVVGSLRTRIKATGKTTATQFALVLSIADGLIGRFQMLEDSFDVARAAR